MASPYVSLCAAQVLEHPWLREQGVAPEQPLAPEVLQRMEKFAAMNRCVRRGGGEYHDI